MSLLFSIRRRKQHFLVEKISEDGIRITTEYARGLVHWGTTFERGRYVKAPLKVFAASPYDRSEFRFHIKCYQAFIDLIKSKGYDENNFEVIDEPPCEGLDVPISIKKNWKPRENQIPAVNYILDENDEPTKLLGLQTGFGKAQPIYSKILTSKGFVDLGSIKSGDLIIAQGGKEVKVLETHPQGETEVYELTFNDGRKVQCCIDHLWRVWDYLEKDKWVLKSTRQLLEEGIGVSRFCEFELYKPWEGIEDNSLDDPYFVGTKINDIDRRYLNASLKQRKELIRGILDTINFSIDHENHYTLTVFPETEEFGLFLQELIWSVGGWCEYYIDSNDQYCCNIRHPYLNDLFRERKFNKKDSLKIWFDEEEEPRLRLSAISSKGITETLCIQIDSNEELYITDNYIVTHNTFISIYALAKLGKRTLYIMRPMFSDKWALDFANIYENGLEDVMVVRGAPQLKQLFKLAKEDKLKASAILISNKTYQSYLKIYEKLGKSQFLENGWICTPDEIWETLDIGALVVDEVHLDFHLNFKLMLYANVNIIVSMSATFISDDLFIKKMQAIYCPISERFNSQSYNRYVSASSYAFQFSRPDLIRTSEYGDVRYSHHVFERSIMKYPDVKENYYRMIYKILKVDFFDIRDHDETAIIFMASVKMCTDFTRWLNLKGTGLRIRRYVDGDDYNDDFINSHIVVTTVGKSGAAVDKPKLRTNIRAIAIRSSTSVYQIFGRTRQLKTGATPRFIYLVCDDIPKQLEYHEHMIRVLSETALDYRHRRHDEII